MSQEPKHRKYNQKLIISWKTKRIYGPELTVLPNVYTERHLYQPLLTNEEHLYRSLLSIGIGNNLWRTTPPALEDSERDFVEDLNRYLRQYHEKHLHQKEIFLLRNPESRQRDWFL